MLTKIFLIALLRSQSGVQEHVSDVAGIEVEDNVPRVFLASATQRQACAHPGSVCLSPGGSATLEGTELREGAPSIEVLARGTQVATVGTLHKPAQSQPWQVEMVADFKSRSTDEPMVVAVMDGENPDAIANHEALVVWDVEMKPGKYLGMRFLLSPEQGFKPSHNYLLRVVQGQGKSEKILAEGQVHLE
jgi:hypothetical protein